MSDIRSHGDEAVQATNDDATVCKRSAVHLGYWKDEFLEHFVRGPVVRKAPEINRGYFTRTNGVYTLVLRALEKIAEEASEKVEKKNFVQIVNLGCGFDTIYWRLSRDETIQNISKNCSISTFIDVDFPATTVKKVQCIKNSKELLSSIDNEDGEISISKYELHSEVYHLVGCDLRDTKELTNKFIGCGIKFERPTIFVSECVLVYLEGESSKNLLSWINEKFKNSLFINYEQVNMSDKFAEVMVSNLNQRGCHLAGVDHCKDLNTQKNRFTETGWVNVNVWTMNDVYKNISKKEIQRIEKIEMLDEQELLSQLFHHYAITVAHTLDYTFESVGFS